jgi:hypothetical protein
MKFTMTKMAAGLVLAGATMGAQAADIAWTGLFAMYDAADELMDANDGAPGLYADVTGFIDPDAGTFSLASTNTFFGLTWATTGGTLYGPGTYTVSTVDAGAGVDGGDYTFTVGAGQLGGHVDFAWGTTTGIDVVMVWDVTTVDGVTSFTSTDWDGDGAPGAGMIDGPFPNFSANFDMEPEEVIAPVPEASTYGMMLAGLGLIGIAVRRRRLKA